MSTVGKGLAVAVCLVGGFFALILIVEAISPGDHKPRKVELCELGEMVKRSPPRPMTDDEIYDIYCDPENVEATLKAMRDRRNAAQ